MPEAAIYEGELNVLPPGRARAIHRCSLNRPAAQHERTNVEAVPAHEIAHIANGDMVTLR